MSPGQDLTLPPPRPSLARLALFPGVIAWLGLLVLAEDLSAQAPGGWLFPVSVALFAVGAPLAATARVVLTRLDDGGVWRRTLGGWRRIAWVEVRSVRVSPRRTRLVIGGRGTRISLFLPAYPNEGRVGMFIRERLRAAGNPGPAVFEEPEDG